MQHDDCWAAWGGDAMGLEEDAWLPEEDEEQDVGQAAASGEQTSREMLKVAAEVPAASQKTGAVSLVKALSAIGGRGDPFSLVRIVRAARQEKQQGATMQGVYVLRSQWCAHFCAGNDRALKQRMEEGTDQLLATEEEVNRCKTLGAVNKHTSAKTCFIVEARHVAEASKKFIPHGSHKWIDLALARLLFTGITPFPSQLPSVEKAALQNDSVDDESDDDCDAGDNNGEADTRDEAAERNEQIQDRVYRLSDFEGVIEVQMQRLEQFATSPVHLGRATGDIRLQGEKTFTGGIKGVIARFLGFAAAELSAQSVKELGLYLLVNGPLIMKFIEFLLTARKNEITSLVAAAHALTKGVAYIVNALEGDPDSPQDEREVFVSRIKLLASQLQYWASSAPKYRPTFQQLLDSGSFLPLSDILAKTVPHLRAAAARPLASVSDALAARDAAVLACVAGDGIPNIRPSELRFLRDPTLPLPVGAASACLYPGCVFPQCTGDFLRLDADGGATLHIVHHKTVAKTGPRVIRCPPGLAATACLRRLPEAAALLRAKTGCRGLMLSKDGGFTQPGVLPALATRELAAAGLKGQTSRSVRRSCVVAGSDNLTPEAREGVARLMGNSKRVRAFSLRFLLACRLPLPFCLF